jgi:polar amino acid transport system substrate-binding protein
VRKRKLLGVMGALFALTLVAASCGGGDAPPTNGGTAGPGDIDISGVAELEDGVLSVASCLDYPPFESVEGGDEVGFDVDLSEAIAEKLGVTVEWVRADFDTIFTAVAGGQFDMVAAAVTATGEDGKERGKIVGFSDFYYNSRQSLAVNTTETPDIASTADLGDGDRVGVQKGTTGKTFAEDNLASQGVEIVSFQSITEAFRDLEAGNLTGVINDEPSSAEIVQGLSGVEVVEPIDTDEQYAFAFAPDATGLIDVVNQGLQAVIDDGTYEDIYAEYFPGVDAPEEFQAAA